MASDRGVVAYGTATPASVHIGDRTINIVGVDAAASTVAHVVAFDVDVTIEHTELVAHGFLLNAVGMTWMTSHSSGQFDRDDLEIDHTRVRALR